MSNGKWKRAVLLLLTIAVVSCEVGMGAHGFGPHGMVTNAVVMSKHVDRGREESHYMVTTDKGTFECDNGFLVGTWNADEIYGSMEIGKAYDIRTKGNKVVGMMFQSYPYVLGVTLVSTNK